MAVTQTTLTAAETIRDMKSTGDNPNAVDTKEEAKAILKFANLKVDMYLKSTKGDVNELAMILEAASEADKYMTSGASDISEEELKAYNAEKENSSLGKLLINNLLNFANLITGKKLEKVNKKISQGNAQLNQQLNNVQKQIKSIKQNINTQYNPY